MSARAIAVKPQSCVRVILSRGTGVIRSLQQQARGTTDENEVYAPVIDRLPGYSRFLQLLSSFLTCCKVSLPHVCLHLPRVYRRLRGCQTFAVEVNVDTRQQSTALPRHWSQV